MMIPLSAHRRAVSSSISRACSIDLTPLRSPASPQDIEQRLVYAMLNEAVRALNEGAVRSPRDGDIGAIFGMGFPPFRGGPFQDLDRAGIDLRLMDARELSYPDATFDHVLAPYVISVVPEPAKVMAEIRRVCKPGGTVMVVNRFRSSNRLLGSLEGLLSTVSQWIGFRLDVPLSTVLGTAGLELVKLERVNLLGLWRMLELRRRD